MDAECCNSDRVKSLVHGTDDSPERVLDWLVLALALVSTLLFVVGNFVLFMHRKRRYFQVAGWDLLLGSSVAGLVWIAAALVVNQHFRRDEADFFSYCALWTFWLHLTFGICGWLAMVALRLYHIYVVVSTKQKPSPVRIWLIYFPLMLAPAIVFSIVATVLRVSRHPCDMYKMRCTISSRAWRLSTFLVLPPVYFSFIVVILVRLRKRADYLLRTQYRQAKESAMMAFVLYLLTGTIYWTNRQNDVTGRCFLTFCVCSLVFVRFWVHTGWPVYLCLFKRGDAMDEYEKSVRKLGALCLQPSNEGGDNTDPESFPVDGHEAIVQAMAYVQAENKDLKVTRESLHRRINQLSLKIEEIQTLAVSCTESFVYAREVDKVVVVSDHYETRHLSLEVLPRSLV